MDQLENQLQQPNIPQEPQPIIQQEIPQKPKLPTWAIVLITVLAISVIGGAGYAAYQYYSAPIPEPGPTQLPASSNEEPADPTADWQTYRNEEYGFEIKYPEDWQTEKTISIESSLVKDFIGFGPQNKVYNYRQGVMCPVSIEISIGTSEQIFGIIYPVLETGIEKNINGYSVFVVETGLGEAFYIFEHPAEKNTRITVRSEIDMLLKSQTERVVEKNELKNIFNQILSTFKFTE